MISVIGLLLVLPYVLFVLLAYFFATTGVAAFLAQKVLTGFGGKENLMLAVTIGVRRARRSSRASPWSGRCSCSAMMVFGIGAAILGVADWRRGRREAAAQAAARPRRWRSTRRRVARWRSRPSSRRSCTRRRTCLWAPAR